MENFDNILRTKNKEIKECGEFIDFLYKYFNKSLDHDSNLNILTLLLYDKMELYRSLKNDADDTSIIKITKIDEYIYKQIKILQYEILDDFENSRCKIVLERALMSNFDADEETKNRLLLEKIDKIYSNLKLKYNLNIKDINIITNSNKSTSYADCKIYKNRHFDKYITQKANSTKIEAVKDIWHFIKENKWVSTVLFFGFGLLIFFLYFATSYKRIPFMQYSDLLSVMISSSAIFLLLPAIFLVMLFFIWFLYYSDKKDGKFDQRKNIYLNSIFVWILAFILSYIALPYFVKYFASFLNSQPDLFVVFIIIFILISTMVVSGFILSLMISYQFFAFIVISTLLLLLILMTIAHLDSLKFIGLFLISISLFFLWIFFILQETDKTFMATFFILSFTMLTIGLVLYLSSKTYKLLDMSNIDYKVVHIEKDALEILPKEICKDSECKFYIDKNRSCDEQNGKYELISILDGNISLKNGKLFTTNDEIKNNLLFENKQQIIDLKEAKKIKFIDGNLTYTIDGEISTKNDVRAFLKERCITYLKLEMVRNFN